MPRQPQKSVTLAPYEQFVIARLIKATGRTESAVIAQMVEQWVVDHPEQVRDAGATMTDFQQQRER
jgi:hypothetical protein